VISGQQASKKERSKLRVKVQVKERSKQQAVVKFTMLRGALSICFLFCLCWPSLAETIAGKVVSVHDGDTLTVLDARCTERKVRLNGIWTSSRSYGRKERDEYY
jgi:endonuclease YncB( thermonuclease family)